MSIYKKINEARSKIEYVKKEGRIVFFDKRGSKTSVPATKHDDVIAACRNVLIDCGIYTSLNLEEFIILDGVGVYKFTMMFVDTDGKEGDAEVYHAVNYQTATEVGNGKTDMRDTGRAFSFAKKTILLSELQLVTGEDDEQTYKKNKEKLSFDKASEFRSRLKYVGIDEFEFVKWFNTKSKGNASNINEISAGAADLFNHYIQIKEERVKKERDNSIKFIDEDVRSE